MWSKGRATFEKKKKKRSPVITLEYLQTDAFTNTHTFGIIQYYLFLQYVISILCTVCEFSFILEIQCESITI